jgi:tripartite-type tricarboxylate transporter receptor subunit TctC
MLLRARALIIAMLAAGLAVAALPASAQTFPSRTVHVVVPYAAGGTGDIVARVVADKLSAALGQSVVVENRPGASGALGTKSVISAVPDGHTLLMGQTGEIAINQHWSKNLGYDPEKDLATPGHFAGEVLKLKTKSNLTHVPYNGAGPALNDLLGAHVDMFFSGFPAAVPHVSSGTLKLIAVSSAKRSGVAPDVPTVAEASGIKDFDITLWQGFFAPRDTPKEIVARLNTEINKILVQPDVKAKLLDAGADVSPISVDAFAAFTKAESAKFLAIVKESGIKPE